MGTIRTTGVLGGERIGLWDFVQRLLSFVLLYQLLRLGAELICSSAKYNWIVFIIATVMFPSPKAERPSSQTRADEEDCTNDERSEAKSSPSIEFCARESAFYVVFSGSVETRILIQKIEGECRNNKQYIGALIELSLFCTARATHEFVSRFDSESRELFLKTFSDTLYQNLSSGFDKRTGDDQRKFVTLSLLRLNTYLAVLRVGNETAFEGLFEKNIGAHFPGVSRILLLPPVTRAVCKVVDGLQNQYRRPT